MRSRSPGRTGFGQRMSSVPTPMMPPAIGGPSSTRSLMKWESPRGPISIDPATRDIVQNVYIRRVEKVGNNIVNVEFDTVPNVKDPTHK